MKQTAVEWLIYQFLEANIDSVTNENMYIKLPTKALQQAKQMEKEQMNELFKAGVNYGAGSVFATEWGEDTDELNFEQYYNETFKSE